MTALEWMGWLAASFAWFMGGVFLWRGFISQSLTRHCPKCDYAMHDTSGLQCPECGHAVANEQQFHKGRRRRKRVVIAMTLGLLGVVFQAAPRVKQNGLIKSMPTTALILYADWGNSEEAFKEIRRRAFDDVDVPFGVNPWSWKSDVLYGWQKTLLTKSCMNVLQPHRPSGLRLVVLKDIIGYRLTSETGDYTQLVACLTDSDPMIQEQSFHSFPEVTNFATDEVNRRINDQLLSIIKQSKDLKALDYAILNFGNNDAIRSELNAWLVDDDPMFRMLACHPLSNEKSKSAYIPVLIDLVTNFPNEVWPITGYTFSEEGGMLMYWSTMDSPGALTELMKAMDHSDVNIKEWAILKIEKMEAHALPALDLLLAKLDDPARRIRNMAIRTIGAIGPEAHRAVPRLLQLIDDQTYVAEGLALEAAIRVDLDPDRLTPLLFEMLPEAGSYNRAALYRAMRWLDLTDDRIVFALGLGLDDDLAEARIGALESLGCFTPASEDIISLLLTGLDDSEERVRLASIETLAKHPQHAQQIAPRLRDSIAHDDENMVRRLAVLTLGTMASDQETLDAIVLAILDEDGYVQAAAIKTLKDLGPKAKGAIAPLQNLLDQIPPKAWTYYSITEALEKIERAIPPAQTD